MSFAKKHKKGVIDWGINTENFEYYKLQDLFDMNGADQLYVLKGVFIHKKKNEKQLKEFGPSPVGILEDKLVNLPNHMLAEVEDILKDEEDIEAIMNGEAVFKIRQYESHARTCYGIDWQEVEESK